MSLQIPKTRDSLQDLIKKLVWTTIQTNYGIGSEEEYNTVINQVVAAGGDTTSIAALQNAAGGSASRVGGFTLSRVVVPTVGLVEYADGDAIGNGAGLVALFRQGVGSGVIQTVTLTCEDSPGADFDVLLFGSNPSTSTLDDNDAAVFTDASLSSYWGRISVPTADWVSLGSDHYTQTISNLGLAVQTTSPTSEFGYLGYYALLARGAITFTAADALRIQFGILQD